MLEGLHSARHALCFGARLEATVTYDPAKLFALATRLAPESLARMEGVLEVASRERFTRLSRRSLSSPLLSICARPEHDIDTLLAARDKPVVHPDRPRDPGNVGAVIRVARQPTSRP